MDAYLLEDESSNTLATKGPASGGFRVSREADGIQSTAVYPLALLSPTITQPPTREQTRLFYDVRDAREMSRLLGELFPTPSYLALDIETRGVNPVVADQEIVGVGLADADTACYFDLKTTSPEALDQLIGWLQHTPGLRLIGHNVMFDGAWLALRWGQGRLMDFPWAYDTYALYRQLANEGYPIQKYGLKDAQQLLLGWETRGDEELGAWLVRNGFYKGNRRVDESPEALQKAYDEGTLRPDKGEMWRAPLEILGYYCALDAAATYQLFAEVFYPAVDGTEWADAFWAYHRLFFSNLEALVEQRLTGIQIDTEKLEEYTGRLHQEVHEAKQAFLTHPGVLPHAESWVAQQLAKLQAREPNRFLSGPKLGKEPTRSTKAGVVSKVWLKWNEKREAIASGALQAESKLWQEWALKYETLTSLGLDAVNVDSPHFRKYLFYDALQFPVQLTTEKGAPATDKKALRYWGEYGQLLKKYNDLTKEAQMIASCFRALGPGARVYPEFKAPGTFTCRLAGAGGLNMQQLPKRREYLECWVPDPGYVMVDCDVAALEPVVLAALSNDPTMMRLYGPDAQVNDIYLYNGAHIRGLSEKIRATGYDPDAPTEEAIARAKKECKKERQIAKVITLGSQYGMGPKKLRVTLDLEGVSVSDEEAYEMWRSYWALYKGVKDYGYQLEREWRKRDGWILGGLGRPLCCAEDYTKDLTNRQVQATGHDIYMLIVEQLWLLRQETGLEYRGVVWDFHDQTIVQCREEDADRMVEIYREAYRRVNELIRAINPAFERILIKGEPMICRTLADAKVQG